ncbi:MAG TPA: hypothetical protein VGN82_12220 [Bosea sp. (in: a-proteobacteria)]|jgi:hypothetical protein|uniref:hypothetical protein n=1 Tax=Bosea sp. (in: a-proteobacteria) TaxID=1871050 RepID=UPI002E10C738|nr:hypothetical protein [Bosea sp. (in: a-proteobacteria)]
MHRLVLAAPVLLAACAPAAEPLTPAFSGWWRPVDSRFGCESRAFRFDRTSIQLRRDARMITTFDIVDASVEQNDMRLTLRVANEAAVLAAMETGKQAMRTELPKTEIVISLQRSGGRLLPSNVLIREDGPRGLRAPRRGEDAAMRKVFTMTACQI